MNPLLTANTVRFASIALAAVLAAAPATASVASSSAYSLLVSLDVTPVGFPLASVNIGPVAQASGAAPPAYSDNATLATFAATATLVSSLPLNADLTAATGLLVNNASGNAASPAFAHGDSTTNRLAIDAVAVPLIGPMVDLASIGATTITSTADVAGSYGALTRTGTSNIEGLSIAGLLGADLVSLGLDVGAAAGAAPNTVLLNALGVRIVANEQLLRGDLIGSAGITTNALHFTFSAFDALGVGLLNGDIVIGHSVADISVDRIATPEPAMLGLFGLGGIAVALGRRRRQR